MLVNVFSESFEMSAADERGCIRALINSSHFLVKLSTFQRKSKGCICALINSYFLMKLFSLLKLPTLSSFPNNHVFIHAQLFSC